MAYEIQDVIPVGKNVLLEVIQPDDILLSGIIYSPRPADKNVESTYSAKVLRCGPGVSDDVRNAKKVFVSKYVNINSARYIIVPEEEIIAVEQEENSTEVSENTSITGL